MPNRIRDLFDGPAHGATVPRDAGVPWSGSADWNKDKVREMFKDARKTHGSSSKPPGEVVEALHKAAHHRAVLLTVREEASQLGMSVRYTRAMRLILISFGIDEHRATKLPYGRAGFHREEIKVLERRLGPPIPRAYILDALEQDIDAMVEAFWHGVAATVSLPRHTASSGPTNRHDILGFQTRPTPESQMPATPLRRVDKTRRAAASDLLACARAARRTVAGATDDDPNALDVDVCEASDARPADAWGPVGGSATWLYVRLKPDWMGRIYQEGFALVDEHFVLDILDERTDRKRVQAARPLPEAGHPDEWTFAASEALLIRDEDGQYHLQWVHEDPQEAAQALIPATHLD